MISVCITTYNGEKHIKQQISSILTQLSQSDEIIVSDDGSSDSTLAIIESLNDERISVYKNKGKKGVIYNFENALRKSKGEFIFLSDQDDVWLENKVKTCLNGLKDADLVVSDCFVTDENLNITADSFFEVNRSRQNKHRALMRNPYLGCCIAFKRSLLDLALPFPEDIPMHDIWLGNVAAYKKKVRFLPEKLIYYRRHGNNVSTASEKSNTTIGEKLKFRLNVIKHLRKLP